MAWILSKQTNTQTKPHQTKSISFEQVSTVHGSNKDKKIKKKKAEAQQGKTMTNTVYCEQSTDYILPL